MDRSENILIIGAGISGITTALLLETAGYRTRIVATERADQPDRQIPEFASLYPAASVIPHSVQVGHLGWHMEVSLAFFQKLMDLHAPGVRLQPHFEVAEFPQEVPDYASLMPQYKKLPDYGVEHPTVPRRPGVDQIYGWQFLTYFAEMPRYLPWLFRVYESLGGTITNRSFQREDFASEPAAAVVNCAGRWAVELVQDKAPFSILRGHFVKLQPPEGFALDEDALTSYNYIPCAEDVAVKDGQQPEVYCYPRRDAWVLGGTRQEGRPALEADWDGLEAPEPTIEVSGIRIPRLILDLNTTLIAQLMGVDISGWEATADVGYRFARDMDGEGVRLEVTQEKGMPVIHNYGHGGAGVALSWSSALQVMRLLKNEVGVNPCEKTPQGDMAELAKLAADQPEKGQTIRVE